MQPIPKLIDSFENGDVGLNVYQYEGPIHNIFRVKAGVAYLDLNEKEYNDLVDILVAYKIENYVSPKDPWLKDIIAKLKRKKKG